MSAHDISTDKLASFAREQGLFVTADRLDSLQRWKDEAIAVDLWWSDAWERVQPLGRIGDKIPVAMADEILRLRARLAAVNDALDKYDGQLAFSRAFREAVAKAVGR